jgi:hypothetical protein
MGNRILIIDQSIVIQTPKVFYATKMSTPGNPAIRLLKNSSPIRFTDSPKKPFPQA